LHLICNLFELTE